MEHSKTKAPVEKVIRRLGKKLGSAAQKARRRKCIADQFSVLSKEILAIGQWLPGVDPSAQPDWMNEIASALANAAMALKTLDTCSNIDEQVETLEAGGLLADALNMIAESLADAGESLAGIQIPARDREQGIDLSTLKQLTRDLVFDMGMVAFRLAGAVGEGLDDDELSIRLPVFSSACSCSQDQSEHTTDKQTGERQSSTIMERTPFTFDRQSLVTSLKEVEGLVERLFILLLEFASLLVVMATGYIPWHCTQDCIGDGALLGATLKRTHAKRLGSGWYQPQISITWEYCCYNLCMLAWNNQFIKTVDSGPHNIGRTVRHPNPVTAQNRARAAAKNRATLKAMLRIGAPGSPC